MLSIPLFTYLISESDGQEFFLQVATPNRNLSRFSPGPFDTIALSQMLALMENTGYSKDALNRSQGETRIGVG